MWNTNWIPRSEILLFLARTKYEVFHNTNSYIGRTNHRLHFRTLKKKIKV
jgi:hypothetical protein